MKKTRLVFAILAASLLLTGCDYFWPGDGDNDVYLPPEVVVAKNHYYSEPAKLGAVIRSKKIFVKNLKGSSSFIGSNNQGATFSKGEKGILSIFVYDPDNPDGSKYVHYNSQVINGPGMGDNTVLIDIIDRYDNRIIEGASGEFTVIVEKKENVLVVPKSAINYYFQRTYVGVLVNGAREDRQVQIGIEGDDAVEVVSGLSAGELVVLN